MNNIDLYRAQLLRDGYCVLPLLDNNLEATTDKFIELCHNAPELNSDKAPHTRFALGGVGYLPFASVTYHPFVRNINQLAYDLVTSNRIFDDYIAARFTEEERNTPGKIRCSMIPDRCLYRFPDQQVCEKGKWHRDLAPHILPEHTDICFGGWINLNHDTSHFFKCFPGSHIHTHPIHSFLTYDNPKLGFANFSDADQLILSKQWPKLSSGLVEVPPGHILVFRESLIHTVFKNPRVNVPLLRIHTSFLVSTIFTPLHDRQLDPLFLNTYHPEHQSKFDYDANSDHLPPSKKKKTSHISTSPSLLQLLTDQELIPVRSGQLTPVYSIMNTWGKNVKHLNELSDHYANNCKEENSQRVLRYLPSLKTLQQLHPPLSSHELKKYFPLHQT